MVREVAALLRERFGARTAKVAKRQVPDWVVRLMALVNVDAKLIAPMIGDRRRFSRDRDEGLLGRPLTSAADAITASVDSLVQQGAVWMNAEPVRSGDLPELDAALSERKLLGEFDQRTRYRLARGRKSSIQSSSSAALAEPRARG